MWWTFLAASIASVTALLVAFVAYPWQKSRDREFRLDDEKRAALKAFFCEIESLLNANYAETSERQSELLLQCKASLNEIALLCSSSLVAKAQELFVAACDLQSYLASVPMDERRHVGKPLEERVTRVSAFFNEALSLARAELNLGESSPDFIGVVTLASAETPKLA